MMKIEFFRCQNEQSDRQHTILSLIQSVIHLFYYDFNCKNSTMPKTASP